MTVPARIATAADMLEDGFPHGTIDGYNAGCRTGHCPAPITCTVVRTRYAADWGFRKRVDAGWTAADIAAADEADAEAAKVEAKAAARRARDAVRAEEKARAQRNRSPLVVRPVRADGRDDHGRMPKTARRVVRFTAAEVRILKARNAELVSDVKIGRELGRSAGSVWAKRQELGLPAVPPRPLVHGTVRGYNRGCRDATCPNTPTCQQATSDYKRDLRLRRAAA